MHATPDLSPLVSEPEEYDDAEEEEEGGEGEDDEDVNLEALTIDQLRDLCEELDLPYEGMSKEDLVVSIEGRMSMPEERQVMTGWALEG